MLVLAFLFFSLLVLSRVGVGLLILIVLRQLNKSPKTFFTWLWGDTARRDYTERERKKERESITFLFPFGICKWAKAGWRISSLTLRPKKPKRWGHELALPIRFWYGRLLDAQLPRVFSLSLKSQRRWAAWERERPRHVNKFNSAEQQGPFWISHHIVLVMMIHRAAAILVGIFFFCYSGGQSWLGKWRRYKKTTEPSDKFFF